MTTTQFNVRLTEIQVAQGDAQFACIGLGSCVGVVVFDPLTKISGVAHIMLPRSRCDETIPRPGKFANTAVPQLIDTMQRLGAEPSRLQAAVAGGAQMCFGPDVPASLGIGDRNVQAVRDQLSQRGIRCVAEDCGGNAGRTLTFESGTGRVLTRTLTDSDRVLCKLG